jgi:hypothetical protein
LSFVVSETSTLSFFIKDTAVIGIIVRLHAEITVTKVMLVPF